MIHSQVKSLLTLYVQYEIFGICRRQLLFNQTTRWHFSVVSVHVQSNNLQPHRVMVRKSSEHHQKTKQRRGERTSVKLYSQSETRQSGSLIQSSIRSPMMGMLRTSVAFLLYMAASLAVRNSNSFSVYKTTAVNTILL